MDAPEKRFVGSLAIACGVFLALLVAGAKLQVVRQYAPVAAVLVFVLLYALSA